MMPRSPWLGQQMQFRQLKRRHFITLLGGAGSLLFCVSAAAQEGYYGVGHEKWQSCRVRNFSRKHNTGTDRRFVYPLSHPAPLTLNRHKRVDFDAMHSALIVQ